mgnify:CR=1 FL=1
MGNICFFHVGQCVIGRQIDEQGCWVPYCKGGDYRKWYGNLTFVIGFDQEHRKSMKQQQGCVWPSQSLWFKEGGTWTAVSSGNLGVRWFPHGCLFDAGGQVLIGENHIEAIADLNTSLYQTIADMTMPTLNYKCGVLKTLPDIRSNDEDVIESAKVCIQVSRLDWDSFETSWDFQRFVLFDPNQGAQAEICLKMRYFIFVSTGTACPRSSASVRFATMSWSRMHMVCERGAVRCAVGTCIVEAQRRVLIS